MKLRPKTKLEWEVQDESNANVVAQPPQGNASHPVSRTSQRRWRLIVFIGTLLLLASSIVVARLVAQAEQNIAQTEREVELAVEADAFLRDPTAVKSHIQSIELHNDLAVVKMSMGIGDVPTGRPVAGETVYYRQSADGWQQIATNQATQEDRGAYIYLEAEHNLFRYFQADRALVEEVIPEIEAFNSAFHRDIGLELPPAHEKANIRVSVVAGTQQLTPPALVDYVTWNSDGIDVLSPQFSRVSTIRASADVLEQGIYVNVAHRIILRAVEEYQPQAVWRPLIDGLQLWAYSAHREFDYDLANSTNNLDNLLSQRLEDNVSLRLPALSILPPPLLAPEEIPATRWQQSVVSKTVIDYMIATYGRHSLARLLDGMHHYDSWQSLVPATFRVSVEEFESGWQAYLTAQNALHP